MPSQKKYECQAIGRQTLPGRLTLAAALLIGSMVVSATAPAQQQASRNARVGSPVIAVTYDVEHAKTEASGDGFWLQGGGIDAAVPFYKGLGIAASFSGEHASSIQPGVNLGKLSYLAGPRYTIEAHHLAVFGEGLFGGAHGFDSIFPVTAGSTPTANSYAVQIGGGMDIPFHRGFGVRVFELDYVRTALPNNGSNTQNDLRLAFGLSYRFNRK